MARILLIEPDKVLAEIYSNYLKKNNHEVAHAVGAQSAIVKSDLFNPEIVILEMQLVEHSGIEFLYEFRSYKDWQNIPIIVFTQVPPNEFNDSIEILKNDLGVSLYLYKPQTNLKTLNNSILNLLLTKVS